MPNFSIALTGLKADSVALNTIGNNLANLNTTAFKKQTAAFSDLIYQNIGVSGASDPLQVGVGTRIGSIVSDFSQGSLVTTGDSANMALNGDGFFVVMKDGTQALTRAGDFQLNSSGQLITSTGEAVMGYPAPNGIVNTNAPLTGIYIPTAQTQPASATTQFSLGGVLNSGSAVGGKFSTSFNVYDSLGNSHSATIDFTKTADNTWSYSISLPAGNATGSSGTTGTLVFDTNGKLISPTSNITGISFTGLSNSSSDMSLQWSLYDASGNGVLTQSATTSSINGTYQNGYPTGTYQSFTVDAQGVITAHFTNGNATNVGQLAIASISNEQGLARIGDNSYLPTQASGIASIGIAGTGGRGDVEGSSIEQSNVDISTEFSDLIVAQRAFQANAKTITAFDSVTQDTINMVR